MARRRILFNDNKSWPPADSAASTPSSDTHLIEKFHRSLPGYAPTPLRPLTHVAQDLGLGAVYIKDESDRLGLPSFKILGASWGAFRAVAQRLRLPLDGDMEEVKRQASSIVLFAATDGNHGRAVAKMGTHLGCAGVTVYVPHHLSVETVELIRAEGAEVIRLVGSSYDDAVVQAYEASKANPDGVFVQDTSCDDYEEISNWIVDGYTTLLREVDEQLSDRKADLVVSPVGVGSLAQSVVMHCNKTAGGPRVLTVEPDTAACLWKSISRDDPAAIETTPTIMSGLDCGSVSTAAWPLLRAGVDACLTVSDFEAHTACQGLKDTYGIQAGPCGGAALAALRRLTESDKQRLGLDGQSVVVLLCTEGPRGYAVPRDVSVNDPVALTQTLVQINSANPSLGSVPGPGEREVAQFISAWLEHRDIETHWLETTEGRPSIIGVVRGTGAAGGKSLMLNGHIDTVTVMGYDHDDALGGQVRDGRIYGRGSADMKGGVAAAMVALANVAQDSDHRLSGDVIFTGVADEEAMSIGTEQVLAAGWRADAALVNEPTNEEIVHAHKGFVWLEVDIHGRASHGSRADLGVDAIAKAGYFLVELDRYAQDLVKNGKQDAVLGTGTAHASLVTGGEEASSYPALCTVSLERRTIPGETAETVKQEVEKLAAAAFAASSTGDAPLEGLRYEIRVTFERPPYYLSPEHPFASLVRGHVDQSLGGGAIVRGERFWTDCALLADKGIPALLWGPRGEGLHAKEEWVEADSVTLVAKTLTAIARDFCQ